MDAEIAWTTDRPSDLAMRRFGCDAFRGAAWLNHCPLLLVALRGRIIVVLCWTDKKPRASADLSQVDLNKLSVGELKGILRDWNEQCRGCTAKEDFVARVKELLPKHPGTSREL